MSTSFTEKTIYTINPKIPKLILTEMLKQCQSLEFTPSKISNDDIVSDYRSSTQTWLCWDTWIAGIMHNMFISANNDYFHYDLHHFDSGIQVTKYEPNQHYDWHVDDTPVMNKNAMSRKLSMTFLLNDNFTGGEFEIYQHSTNKNFTYKLNAGEVCIFPSWVVHRVKPVLSGTRYSLVAWMNGNQFK